MHHIFPRRYLFTLVLLLAGYPDVVLAQSLLRAQSCFNVFEDSPDPTIACSDASYLVQGANGGSGFDFFPGSSTGLLDSHFDGFDVFELNGPLAPPDNLLAPFFSDIEYNQTTTGGQITSFDVRERGVVAFKARVSTFQNAVYGSKSRITFIPFTTDGSTDPVPIDLDFNFAFTLRDPSDNATRGGATGSATVQVLIRDSDDPFFVEFRELFGLKGQAQLDLEQSPEPEFSDDFIGAGTFQPTGPGIGDEFDIQIGANETVQATPDQPLTLDTESFGAIFSDGFEAGDTSAWSVTSLDTLMMSVSSANPNVRFKLDTAPRPRRGLYWDRSRSGHGFDLQRSGDNWFLLLYTYRDDESPLWYLALGSVADGVFTGTASQFDYDPSRTPPQKEISGSGGPVTIDFNPAAVAASSACNDSTDRSSALSVGAMDFDLDGKSGQWCVEPFVFSVGKTFNNFTGSWFNSNDPGWGLTIYTQGSEPDVSLVVVLYYYDADGMPRWALGVVSKPDLTKQLDVAMSQFSGFCPTCSVTALGEDPAGSVKLKLVQPSSVLTAGNTVQVNVNFAGAPGGSWVRAVTPIQLLSDLPNLP